MDKTFDLNFCHNVKIRFEFWKPCTKIVHLNFRSIYSKSHEIDTLYQF